MAAIRRLVAEENWNGMASLVGDKAAAEYRKLAEPYGGKKLAELLEQIHREDTEKLTQGIKKALKDATSFQFRGLLGDKLIQLHKRAEDHDRKARLLTLALADRLTDLVFPAAERAAKLTNLIVKDNPTPEAEKYLEEACLCYFYELYSASAVMCRSVLEEVIEKRIRRLGLDKELKESGRTLGALLGLAKRPALRNSNIIPPEVWFEIQTVNHLGSRAVHEGPVMEEDAWECLTAARHVLVCMLT